MLVLGPSGSGKSTLALAIGGLLPREIPASMGGLLSLDGQEIRGLPPTSVAARVGMVWQDPDSQLVMERVEDDVAFGLENRGWALPAMRERVPEALTQVGLGGLDRQRSRPAPTSSCSTSRPPTSTRLRRSRSWRAWRRSDRRARPRSS